MGRTQEHPGTAMLYAARMARTPICLQIWPLPADLAPEPQFYPDITVTFVAGRAASFLPPPHPPALHSLDLLLLPKNSYQETKCKPRIKPRVYWVSFLIWSLTGWRPLRNHDLWGPWLNSGLISGLCWSHVWAQQDPQPLSPKHRFWAQLEFPA